MESDTQRLMNGEDKPASELAMREQEVAALNQKVEELKRKVAELDRRFQSLPAPTPLPDHKPDEKPEPPKLYRVALVRQNGAVAELETSTSRQALEPRPGFNVMEITDDALWAEMLAGVNGASKVAPGRLVGHYWANGAFHEQQVLQLEAVPGPITHPGRVEFRWKGKLGAVRFRREVFDGEKLDAKEEFYQDRAVIPVSDAGDVMLEVDDPRFVIEQVRVHVE